MGSELTRRSAITLSVMAPTTGMAFPLGGEIDSAMVGVNVRLAWQHEGWTVLLPDWKNLSEYWRPGMAVPSKWVPLAEYLGELEREFKLTANG